MMRDEYLNKIILRGNDITVLEQAALLFPRKTSAVRWAVAAAFGMLLTFLPSVCTAAHAFSHII